MASRATRPPISTRSIIVGAVAFLLVSVSLGYVLNFSFSALSQTADEIDDARALTAASAAVETLRDQLGATVRDNAYWDDAYRSLATPERIDWAISTWGVTTEDYPLYDSFMLLGASGTKSLAYHKGREVNNPLALLDKTVMELVQQARLPKALESVPVAFISTRRGLMMVGAATIRPLRSGRELDSKKLDVLLFGKLMTPEVVESISKSFSIAGLRIVQRANPHGLNAPLKNPLGQNIGYFTWPSAKPGSKSFEQVKPVVHLLAGMFVLLLTGVSWLARLFVTNLRALEAAARHDASHDPLTGLLNRTGLQTRLKQILESSSGRCYMHLLDLDSFKYVNDTWGHPVGDELLRAVGSRIGDYLPDALAICRLGGDEFAIASNNHSGRALVELFKEPFDIEGWHISTGASIGVVELTYGSSDTTEMMRRADVALYLAKGRGKNRCVDYEASFDEEELDNKALAADLRKAMDSCAIDVVFQPIVCARNSKALGVEALARWHHPTRGVIPPDRFIRVAEQAGIIHDLGRIVMCKAMLAMSEIGHLFLSVNVSPVQLNNPQFVGEINFLLQQLGFEPTRLILEVTEGVIISQPELARDTLSELRKLGVRTALDDFGCGYASIGSLKNFSFDKVKIDRSLACGGTSQDAAFLQATLALAMALNLPVTAEGVENRDQARKLLSAGCTELQGYLFSRPLPLTELKLFISADADHRAEQPLQERPLRAS